MIAAVTTSWELLNDPTSNPSRFVRRVTDRHPDADITMQPKPRGFVRVLITHSKGDDKQ